MYAVPGRWGDASMRLMREKPGMSFGVTFFQFFAPSRVMNTYPSSEPVQMRLPSFGEGAIVNTVPYVSTPVSSRVIGPPESPIVDGSCRVRSGLMRVQPWPPFVVFHTCCDPTYSVPESVGEDTIGKVH